MYFTIIRSVIIILHLKRIDDSSFLILNSSFHFRDKEKDKETSQKP